MLSSGKEDHFEVLELEQAETSRSIPVSGLGLESNPETLENLEIFASIAPSKVAMTFNHVHPYTEPIFAALFPHYSGRPFDLIMLRIMLA